MIEFRCKVPRHTFTLELSFAVEAGEVYSLFGPSAAGKSSILQVMAGFENQVSSAYLSLNNRVLLQVGEGARVNVPAWQRGIVLVEQGSLLFPHLTVEENIRYGLRNGKLDAWLQGWIEQFGLAPYLALRPHQLSGGLLQRAILARAIAGRPEVLLLDEPFSALDWPLRRVLQDFILELRHELGTTILMVTHQLAEAQRMADKMGILDQGKMVQEGSPLEVLTSPNSWKVARLLGYTHLLSDQDGRLFALHPSRVIPGDESHRGPVLRGQVRRHFLYEGESRVALELLAPGGPLIEVAIPMGVQLSPGEIFVFTVPDPPYVS